MILYTWPYFFDNESEILNTLLFKGVDWLHIYKPSADIKRVQLLIENIASPFRSRLVIHFYYPLAQKYGLGGIHFSQNDYNLKYLHENLAWISRSAHLFQDLEITHQKLTHLIVSPIFKSISKPNHQPAWNFDQLSKFLKQPKNHNIKYVALGGITPLNYSTALQMGFDDAAFLGSFWKSFFQKADLSIINIFKHAES